jgi:hypothetical protein
MSLVAKPVFPTFLPAEPIINMWGATIMSVLDEARGGRFETHPDFFSATEVEAVQRTGRDQGRELHADVDSDLNAEPRPGNVYNRSGEAILRAALKGGSRHGDVFTSQDQVTGAWSGVRQYGKHKARRYEMGNAIGFGGRPQNL